MLALALLVLGVSPLIDGWPDNTLSWWERDTMRRKLEQDRRAFESTPQRPRPRVDRATTGSETGR